MLATFPIVAGVPDSVRLLNIVFILVVVFTLVQGPSLRLLAHRLGLIPKDATREIQVEAAPLDVLEAELLTMTVQSRVAAAQRHGPRAAATRPQL